MPVTSSIVRVEASRHASKENAVSLLSDRYHIKTKYVLCMYDLSDSSDFESIRGDLNLKGRPHDSHPD